MYTRGRRTIKKSKERQNEKSIISELIGALHFSKLIVAIAFAELTLYAIAAMIIFYQTGAEPEVLTQCFYTVIGAEFGLTAFVTAVKTVSTVITSNKNKSDDTDDLIKNTQIYIDAANNRAE